MKYSRRHLADQVLLDSFHAHDTRHHTNLAELLADLAEIEVRRLYAPAGYSSLFDYCVQKRNWSEDMAGMRLRVARVGRKFPALLDAIADGRLHLTGAFLIAKKMTRRNCDELISAATKQSRRAIARMLAARDPQADVPQVIRTIAASPVASAAGFDFAEVAGGQRDEHMQTVPERSESTQPVAALPVAPISISYERSRSRITPLSATTQAVQFTMRDPMSEKLQRFAALAGHRVPSGDVAALLELALDYGIAALEKRKYATTGKPRAAKTPKAGSRHVPAEVRREVRERDGERCTFVSDDGHPCGETRGLEFDHIVPVAKGGPSTADNLRLRCRTHNQYAADQTFGAGFMDAKRRASVEARADRMRARAAARAAQALKTVESAIAAAGTTSPPHQAPPA